jgi:hypothetical protein
MIWSSIIGLVAGGITARYMRSTIAKPAILPHFIKILKISVTPTKSKPAIKIISIKEFPAKEWKNEAKGPLTAPLKKP